MLLKGLLPVQELAYVGESLIEMEVVETRDKPSFNLSHNGKVEEEKKCVNKQTTTIKSITFFTKIIFHHFPLHSYIVFY